MPHHDPTSIAADGRRRRAKRTSNRPHRTLAARVWAVALAALLPMGTLGPACGAGDEGRDPRDVQTREFGRNGEPVKLVDWTDHGRPAQHTDPHVHDYVPNPTGGTPQHGPHRPARPGEF